MYELADDGDVTVIPYAGLHRAATLIAACCLMTKSWPVKGARHKTALAFAAILLKAGYDADTTATAIYEVAKLASDEEAIERRSTALYTAKRYHAGEPVIGITVLRSLLPEASAKCLMKWLEFSPMEEVEERVAELNEKYAFIIIGGTARILNFQVHPVTGEPYTSFMKPDAFKGLYKNERVVIGMGKNGPIEKSIAEIWLSHMNRRTYESMAFEPGKQLPSNVFNYWRGFSIEPLDNEQLCEPFLSHLLEIICNGNIDHFHWLVSWLAHMVQKPGEKPGTAVILIGPQGAGKTCVGEFIGEMFKPHFLKVNNAKHLLGNFNAHHDGIVFALCEEAFLAGDKAAQGALKDLITSDTMMIERKGVDSVKARNCLHLLLTSNNPWVVSAGIDDRRFFVLEVSGQKANDYQYFSKFKESQKNSGPAALLDFLMKFDYSQVELHKPPQTHALVTQKLETLEPIGKVLYKFLAQGHIYSKNKEWPEWIETEQLCEICFAGTKKVGVADKGLQTKLGMLLPKYIGLIKKEKKCLPEIDIDTGLPYPISIGAKKVQQIVYVLPSLQDCRKRFTDLTGIPFENLIEG